MNRITLEEMAERIGVSKKTLRDWDNQGKLVAHRTLGNHRYYTEQQIAEYSSQNQSIARLLLGEAISIPYINYIDDVRKLTTGQKVIHISMTGEKFINSHTINMDVGIINPLECFGDNIENVFEIYNENLEYLIEIINSIAPRFMQKPMTEKDLRALLDDFYHHMKLMPRDYRLPRLSRIMNIGDSSFPTLDDFVNNIQWMNKENVELLQKAIYENRDLFSIKTDHETLKLFDDNQSVTLDFSKWQYDTDILYAHLLNTLRYMQYIARNGGYTFIISGYSDDLSKSDGLYEILVHLLNAKNKIIITP